MKYYSQPWVAQDAFVAETLKFKTEGFFVDIGCHEFDNMSNTYFLENDLNWKGLAVDIECTFKEGWDKYRPNSIFLCHDATTLDYQSILDHIQAPKVIDYLSVDTEPPQTSLDSLIKIMETDYVFRIITFETDHYTGDLTAKDPSRKLLKEKGYIFVKSESDQDDFWFHSSMIEDLNYEPKV